MKIVIVGAGPIGLEAAVAAQERGHTISVFERGRVADSVRNWGHVRMFSPFGMNASNKAIALLARHGRKTPGEEAILTGQQYADDFLQPLAEVLNGCVHAGAEVVAITRDQLQKWEKIMDPTRAATPFRLLVKEQGRERVEHGDVLFDCTGVFGNPSPLGVGGIPTPGEIGARDWILYGMPEVKAFGGAKVLVVGAGHSAATVIRELSRLPGTEVIWAVRKPVIEPCDRIKDDPLPERDSLLIEANHLARSTRLKFCPNAIVNAVERINGELQVILNVGGITQVVQVDRLIATTGFRPDMNLARELQVQTCWATEGSYNLSALLLGEAGGDCLKAPVAGVEMLAHPEPGFFTLGIKSYGRRSDFLIRTGRKQVQTVLDSLQQKQA
jgi:thioredoxin reductase